MSGEARHTHDIEQAVAGLVEIASALGQYFQELMRSGFTRDEALRLTVEYQRILITTAKGDSE